VSEPPRIRRVLETALYVDEMDRAVRFYRDVMGLASMSVGERLSTFDAGDGTVLLLFRRGVTREGLKFAGGWIPPHDGAGPLHVAFAIDEDALVDWEAALAGHGVAIESRVSWTGGGRSLYLRDPDGHSVELVTPHTWANY